MSQKSNTRISQILLSDDDFRSSNPPRLTRQPSTPPAVQAGYPVTPADLKSLSVDQLKALADALKAEKAARRTRRTDIALTASTARVAPTTPTAPSSPNSRNKANAPWWSGSLLHVRDGYACPDGVVVSDAVPPSFVSYTLSAENKDHPGELRFYEAGRQPWRRNSKGTGWFVPGARRIPAEELVEVKAA